MDKKILIADIDENLMIIMEAALALKGFQVITARTGKEAFQRIRKERPDLIIIDTALPEMSGYQIVHKMHSEDELKRIPIIVVSEKAQMRELFTSAEIFAFLTKPLLPAELMKEVQFALKAGATSRMNQNAEKQTVVVIGLEGFLLERVTSFLNARSYSVIADIELEKIIAMRPRLLLANYEDAPGGGPAGELFREIKRRKEHHNLSFYVICPEPLLLAAVKNLPQEIVLKYKEAGDLCNHLESLLRKG